MKETFTVLNNVAKHSSEKLNGELLFREGAKFIGNTVRADSNRVHTFFKAPHYRALAFFRKQVTGHRDFIEGQQTGQRLFLDTPKTGYGLFLDQNLRKKFSRFFGTLHSNYRIKADSIEMECQCQILSFMSSFRFTYSWILNSIISGI